ncbi:Hint domain-containing protein [uncultured Tateyamaria sp.]|uniref:Hint domain-containing protein n=1 Tax=uncultured Tateyamaria sp. TaxID=455651 RepID=UPI00261C00AD|nr:Hint domain-containing protein [uncultured Tateyamaria sp.]
MTKFIDFNDLSTGTVVDNEFSSQGVTVSAVGGSNKAMIFNTAHPTGGDTDLRTTNLGKALIISEDGNSHDPDDNASGGTFKFAFDDLADINRLTFLDIEEGARVKFFAEDGSLIKTVHVSPTEDNGQVIMDFDVAGVARMDVTLYGSGAIDNLVFDDTGADGVVEGNNEGNLIDAAYLDDPDGDVIDGGDAILPGEGPDDDIVDAFGGDDTIESGAGDDEVYAGSGSDSVDGGDGNDLILGDANYSGPNAGATVRESFEWDEAGFGDGEDVSGFTQNTGNVDVTFSIIRETGAADTEFSTDDQNVQNIDDDGTDPDNNSSLDSVLNGQGNEADYQLDFSAPVEDVSFRINDVDGDGIVRVKAFDSAGNPIVVYLEGGDRLTLSDTDGVAGNDTADSNGGYLSDESEEYSVLVSIPGPVSRIVIEHDQDGGNNSGINVTDVYFDAPVVDDGAAGDDTLNGGLGDDTIEGGEGDDVVSGGEGDDQLHGGPGDDILNGDAGEDTINGGAGDDTIDGGDDDDVINGGEGSDSILGGGGNDLITSSDPDNDLLIDKGYPFIFEGEEGTPEAENERDFVDGGAGNDTISTGDDRDTIVGGTGDDVIDGGIDDDEISGDDGADRIVGGEGNDLIEGGDGNDTIFAGNDPVLGLDFLNIEDDGSNINGFGPDLRPDNGLDTVFGGEGNDVIFGADDDDVLFGEEGDDTIDGEIDDDLIDGGTGNDSLRGGQGNDTVMGGDGQDTIDGGIGEDEMSGGADEDLFINVNAGDVVDGGSEATTGTDFDVLDLTGSAPEGGSFTIDITGPDSNGNGFDGVVNYFDSDGNAAGSLTFTEIEDIIPCFTPGTMIATASGERLVQDLKVGDRVITRDNGIQEIRWVGTRDMSGSDLAKAAHLRPVLIRQGALGKGLPERDMLVSPQHRVLMASDKTALYFDEAEVLVAAKHLTDMEGIDVVEVSHTTYIHVMFDQHEVILSDGTWTESFQPGDQTLASMGDGPRAEILELFPELETEVGIQAYAAARRSLKKHEAKLLTQ